ncbi:MAG TPA: asparagine synthase (glutamine-hydrolyzing) [Candidatus Competibacteraceae bacterium]|nr:MAG: asparagine synthase (glutamine-hydrolyzing) [Candidatus Competibacteraceae bacterium]HQC73053.1 asparagine synthase (glutamine-hydrolyzing) [Candidatus Competibacteraceae bacterium]
MCGIAGVFLNTAAPDQARLSAALAALHHRGPDDSGLHIGAQVGLAFTRLSIIDLDHGHQPLYSADKTLCLIGNGEIYNYLELRRDLAAKGYPFSTQSDFEPLLYAYLEYGLDFLQRLEGMFAFALYDQRQNRLLLVRDRLGIKPLFFTQRSDGLYFGSEFKALLALHPQRPTVNAQGLAQYLQSGFAARSQTLCQGIERLGPGEALLFDAGHFQRRWHYWSLQQIQPLPISPGEADEQFTALMDDVMRKHLRADVPFGLFLSGGIDSSTLLALIRNAGAAPLRSYSIGFPGSEVFNESSEAERIARHFGIEHVTLALDGQAMFAAIPHAIWAADELIEDSAGLALSALAARAAADVKMVFTGDGGDEAFAGYGRYRRPYVQRLLRSLIRPGSGGYRTKPGFTFWSRRGLFQPALLRANDDWRAPFIESWQSAPRAWSDLQRMQAVDVETVMADRYLVKTDRMTMAWGLEARVPFLDHRVIEFGLALPDALKIEGRLGKAFLRRWAQRWLPLDHLQLRKRGLSVPVDDWPRGPRLQRLEQALLGSPGIQEWFLPAGIRALVAAQQRKPASATRIKLLRLLHFMIWHRLFIEGNGAEPARHQDPLEFLGV